MNQEDKDKLIEKLKQGRLQAKPLDFSILTDRQRSAMKNMPKRFAPTVFAAYSGEASPSKAIRAKCIECCGTEDVDTNIGGCTISTCPLWHYRPYQSKV